MKYLLLAVILSFSQTSFSNLYNEDLQFLINKLEKNYPWFKHWEKISGKSIITFPDDNINNEEDFVWRVQSILNQFPDTHLRIHQVIPFGYYTENYKKLKLNRKNANDINTRQLRYITTNVFFKVKTGLRFKYINGKYFNNREFTINGTTYPKDTEVIEINNIEINKYVEKNLDQMVSINYDFNNKQYFSDYFHLNRKVVKQENFSLSFKLKDKIKKEEFSIHKTVDHIKENKKQNTPEVVLKNNKTLYLRIPSMYKSEFYSSKIKELIREQSKIEEVIIDIKNNGGGNDKVWKEIISYILPNDQLFKSTIYFNKDVDKNILKAKVSKRFDHLLKDDVLVLENEELIKSKKLLNPKKITLLYNQNCKSSASSFIEFGKNCSLIHTRGENLTQLSGSGFPPILIQLPNTKLLIQIPYTIDATGVKSIIDFTHALK
jgi:hypothetical protein